MTTYRMTAMQGPPSAQPKSCLHSRIAAQSRQTAVKGGRRVATLQASQRPNPGSKRKVSSNDLTRLSKIFGPSRYTTAYGPPEEAPPPPPAPDTNSANNGNVNAEASARGSARRPAVARPSTPGAPPSQDDTSPAAAWAGSVLAQQGNDDLQGKAILQGTKNLQQLVALSREPQGRLLGPLALLAVANRAYAIASTQGIADEQELEDAQALGDYLVLATHTHITATAYSTSELALLLRTPLCLNHPPSAAWLRACEASTLRIMSRKAQQLLQQGRGGSKAEEEAAETEGRKSVLAGLVEEADGIFAICASFVACGFQPRKEFVALFMDLAAGYMQLSEQRCLEAEKVFQRAAEATRVGRRGGLIQVPEQLEVDEVLMADGSSYTAEANQESKGAAHAQQQQQQQAGSRGGAITADDLCVVNSFNWDTICEAVLRWEGGNAPEQWVQVFVDSSFAAMRASICVMTWEMDAARDDVVVEQPLVARVLDTTVMANIITATMYAFKASPGEDWVDMLCRLCRQVLEHVREHGGQDQEALEASGGMVASPVALGNILNLLRFVGKQPEPALVNAALAAVGKSYGGQELRRVPGDALATLLLETGRHQYEVDETAKAAAVEMALEAQNRWAAALQERMAAEAKRRGRAVPEQQGQVAVADSGEAEEQQKELEFTKLGMLYMLEGAASLGILPQLPPEWMLLWGEEAMGMAEEFDAEEVILCMLFAAKAGVSISAPARIKLVGRLLEVAAPKPVPESATISSAGGSAGGDGSSKAGAAVVPNPARELLPMDKLRDVMEALLMQVDGVPLPGAWGSQMQALMEVHLPSMELTDIVSSLKVLGLLEAPPSEAFLQRAVVAYTAKLAQASLGALAAEVPAAEAAGAAADAAAAADAPGVLARDEEACLELASGLAAARAPVRIMQIIEDASLRWCPGHPEGAPSVAAGVALEFWVGLLAKFASAAHVPQQGWWEAMQVATLGPAGSGADGGGCSSGGGGMQMSDAQLANLLAAYGALRVQQGPGLDKLGGAWAARLALQAASRLDGIGTTRDAKASSTAAPNTGLPASLQSVVYLVGGLGTLFMLPTSTDAPLHPHIPRVCAAIEHATLAHAALLNPALVAACFAVFSPAAYAPGAAWLESAGAATARGLPSTDGHDLAMILAACEAIPEFRAHMPTPVMNTLLRTAVQEGAAGGLQPNQLLSLLSSAAGLRLDARVGAPHATQLRTLLEQAAGMRDSLPPAGVAQVLKCAALMGAQPPARWLDAMLCAFEGVDFLGPAFGGPEPLLQLLAALDAYDHHPLPPWLRQRLCEALPGMADMGVHAMRLLEQQQQQQRMGRAESQPQPLQDPQQQQQQQQQQEGGAQGLPQGVREVEIPMEGEEGEAVREAMQAACLQCSHTSVLLLQYLANTSPRTRPSRSSSSSSSGRAVLSRRAASSQGSAGGTSGLSAPAAMPAGIPADLLTPALNAFQQLAQGDCLAPADHAGLVYSLARLHPAKMAARADSVASPGSKTQKEGPEAAAAAACDALLASLLPATASALHAYSMLELMTIFSSFGALGAPLSPAWLDVFWEYSCPQLSTCPAPMLAACLDAMAALGVRPAGAWEGALWATLAARALRLTLTDIEQLITALLRAQLRPPQPLLQQLLDAALAAAHVPTNSPATAATAAAAAAAVQHGTAGPGTAEEGSSLAEGVISSTRVPRSARASSRAGPASVDDAAAAAQQAERALQLSRVLSVACTGLGYQPPLEWLQQFRGAAALALGSRQLPPRERTMLMEAMQATAGMQ